MTTNQVYSLQLLRPVAASLVIVDHSILGLYGSAISDDQLHLAWTLGDAGVETFFVLSGCLMMMTSMKQFGRPGSPLRFMKRRVLRIVPLYWLMTTLALLIMLRKGQGLPVEDAIRSYLFIPYANSAGLIRPIVQAGWTLNYEMLFYLVFAVALFLPRFYGIVLLAGLFTALVGFGFATKPLWDTTDPVTLFQAWTDPIILVFLAGALIGLVRPWLADRIPTLSPVLLTALGTAVLVVGCVAVAWTGDAFPRLLAVQWGLRLCAAVAVLICLVPNGPPVGAFGRLFYVLGNASYSTYLAQGYAIRNGLALINHTPLHNKVAVICCLVVLANALGLVVHKLIELPFLEASQAEQGLLHVFRAGMRRRMSARRAG